MKKTVLTLPAKAATPTNGAPKVTRLKMPGRTPEPPPTVDIPAIVDRKFRESIAGQSVKNLLVEYLDSIAETDPAQKEECDTWRDILDGRPAPRDGHARRTYLVTLTKRHTYRLRDFTRLYNVSAEDALATMAGEQIASLDDDAGFERSLAECAIAHKEQRIATAKCESQAGRAA